MAAAGTGRTWGDAPGAGGRVPGGNPPRRPDQLLQPISRAGVGPAPQQSVITARRVILTGPGEALFAYNGTPGANNLAASILPQQAPALDPTGHNLALGGVSEYVFDAVNSTYDSVSMNGETLSFFSAATEAGPWTLQAQVTGFGNNVLGQLSLTPGSGNFASISGKAVVGNAAGAGWYGSLIANVGTFNVPVAETWHAAVLNANFAAGGTTPRYQLESVNGGRVRLSGAINCTVGQPAGTAMFNLPAGYRPSRVLGFVTPNNIVAAVLGQQIVQVGTGGDVSCTPAITAGHFLLLDGICLELD
jgi:hypothetical protein